MTVARYVADFVAKHPKQAARQVEPLLASEFEHQRERGAAIAEALKAADRCRVCGLALKDPESVRLGIGPDCRAKEDA